MNRLYFILFASVLLNLLLVALTGFIYFKSNYKVRFEAARLHATFSASEEVVLLLGDSMMEGFDSGLYLPGFSVYNLGRSGTTTNDLLQQLESLASLKPEKIFIWIGINDLRYGISQVEIVQNIEKVIVNLRKKFPEASINILGLTPVAEKSKVILNARNNTILELNKNLKHICEHWRLNYIEVFPYFTSESELKPDLTYDGLHLNQAGYTMFKKVIFGFVSS